MLSNREEPVRVLLVESDSAAASNFEMLLKNLDFEVVSMKNGFESLEFAREEKPDIVIAEFRLKGLDGLSLCKLLKADDRYFDIKVVLTTHHDCREYRNLAEQAGADGIIFKPCSYDNFLAIIENVSGRCRWKKEGMKVFQ
jgi:DNA-binding response OmpR family regulator